MDKKKLKICFIGDSQSPQEIWWAETFASFGHEVHMISPYDSDIKGVIVHPIKTFKGKSVNYVFSYLKVRKVLKKIKPDLVNGFFLGSLTYLGILARFHPFMSSVWGSDVALMKEGKKPLFVRKFILKSILRNSDVIQVPDKASLEYLRNKYGIGEQRLFLQYWGIKAGEFNPSDKEKDIDVLFLRKTQDKYSPEIFVRALAVVKKDYPKIKSTIIKGRDYEKIKKLIVDLGLADNIDILDWDSHGKVSKLFHRSLLYVDSFQRVIPGSGFGMTAMEAMACEVPVILADNPGVNEYIVNGENGILYSQGDAEELASSILKLMRNKALRKKLGENGRKTVLEKLDWNKNSKIIEKKYLQMAS